MRRVVVLSTALVACRFGFDDHVRAGDAGSDVSALGHDEDGDGIDDGLDVCPHLADPLQPDGDGDRVGDACDPDPASPTERIVVFDPFTSLRAEWSFVGPMPTVDGERLAIDTTDGQQLVMSLPSLASASDRHAVGGRIIGAGTAQRFFALGFGSPPMFPPIGTSTAAYYCEHCAGGACGTTPFFSFTYTLDNSQFTHVQQTPTPPLAAGAFAFSADRAPPSIACTTSWPAGAQVGGSIPSAVTPSTFGIAVKSLAVSVDYFVLIRTE